MIGRTEDLIERPDRPARGQMDVLSDMLASLRLSGGVFLDGELRAPWAVVSHLGPEDCAAFFDVPHHVVAYHFVRSGTLSCQVGDGPRVEVRAGEIVLLPKNEPHYLHGPVPCRPVDANGLVKQSEDGILRLRHGGDGETTEIYCGYLGTTAQSDPLLASLPSILTVAADAAGTDWVARSIEFATEQLGANSPEMVGKLAEGLFAEAVRRYFEAMPEAERGWLAGLRDPAVGKALELIHARYAEAWTLDALAREAGVSKTVLAERFRAHIGESPMQYCARWRMRVAANMLRDHRENSASIAYSVGFNSEAAFNRAFKREYGAPPATWRREAAA
jgi:AraC-like DNA-binding protein